MIQSLPNEILLKTFSYLPFESLVELAQISTKWSYVVAKLGACRLDFSRMDYDQPETQNEMVTHIKNQIPNFVEAANIRYLLIASRRLVPYSVFVFLQFLYPNVNTFDYDHDLLDISKDRSSRWLGQRHSLLPSGPWQKSIAHLPACFDGVQILSRDDVLCRRLESLYIGRDDVLSRHYHGSYRLSLRDLPQLTSLTLHAPFPFDETMINEIHRKCPRLRSLTLRDTSLFHASDSPYHFRSEVFFIKPELQVLKLENVTFLNYQMFCFFPNKYPNINTLTLSTNHQNYQQFSKSSYYKSVREYILEMILSFKCLTKVTVHLKGFGKKKELVNVRYPDNIEAYFSKVLNKHIQVEVTYS